MPDLHAVSIIITVSVAVDPIDEPPKLKTPLSDQLRCEQFYSCASEYCAKHGCMNAQQRGHSTQDLKHATNFRSVRYV